MQNKKITLRRSILYKLFFSTQPTKPSIVAESDDDDNPTDHNLELTQCMEQAITETLQRPVPYQQDKIISIIRESNIVAIKNLHTKYKALLEHILEKKLGNLKLIFKKELNELLQTFMDLKAQIHRKDIIINEINAIIANQENQLTESRQKYTFMQANTKFLSRTSIRLENQVNQQFLETQKFKDAFETNQQELDNFKKLYYELKNQTMVNDNVRNKEREELNQRIQILKDSLHQANLEKHKIQQQLNEAKENSFLSMEQGKQHKEMKSELERLRRELEIYRKSQSSESGMKQQVVKLKVQNMNLKDELKRRKEELMELREFIEKKQSEVKPENLDELILHKRSPGSQVDHYYQSPRLKEPKFDVQKFLSSSENWNLREYFRMREREKRVGRDEQVRLTESQSPKAQSQYGQLDVMTDQDVQRKRQIVSYKTKRQQQLGGFRVTYTSTQRYKKM